jgi:hypothetical protein
MRYALLIAAFIAVGCTVAQAGNGCNVIRGGLFACVRGNTIQTYDANGRRVISSVRRGNVMRHYDANGRPMGYAVYANNNTSWRHYSPRGRLLNTSKRYHAAGGQFGR